MHLYHLILHIALTIETPYDHVIPYNHSTPFFTLHTITSALAHIQLDTALGSDQIHPALLKYSVPLDYKERVIIITIIITLITFSFSYNTCIVFNIIF